jgi:hypothetical protein
LLTAALSPEQHHQQLFTNSITTYSHATKVHSSAGATSCRQQIVHSGCAVEHCCATAEQDKNAPLARFTALLVAHDEAAVQMTTPEAKVTKRLTLLGLILGLCWVVIVLTPALFRLSQHARNKTIATSTQAIPVSDRVEHVSTPMLPQLKHGLTRDEILVKHILQYALKRQVACAI